MKPVVRSLSLWLAVLSFAGLLGCKPAGKATLTSTTEPNSVVAQAAKPNPLEIAFRRGTPTDLVPVVERTWENQYGNYFRRSFPDQSITAKDVTDTLSRIAAQTGTKPALMYVVPQQNQLELVLLTPGNEPIRKSVREANKEALLRQAKEFSDSITDPSLRNTTNYLQPAQQLYKWMVAPVESELQAQGIDTLILCMGAGLRALPVAALHDGQKFLAEKYSLTRIPAFKLTNTVYANLKRSQVLAMGASQFQEQEPLPAVPVEISAIAQRLWQGKSFLNQQFTLANLRSQRASQPYKIIHLATHADFRPGIPNDSYIQFWDSKLTLDQIGQLGLQNPPVELLVLSACRTAIGDEQAELGFAGLAVQAGVKSAIASLWYVSDEATLALMTEFYRHLQTAPIKAEALKQAQIEMIKGHIRIENGRLQSPNGNIALPPALAKIEKQNFSHPFYWAAFTVVGNPW